MLLIGREHVARLKNSPVGSKTLLRAVTTSDGLSVESIIRLTPPGEPAIAEVQPDTLSPYRLLTVKWFNQGKGYGFLVGTPENRDVFLHIATLEKHRLRVVRPTEDIWVRYGINIKNGMLTAVEVSFTKPADA